jgi:hypothetical protein
MNLNQLNESIKQYNINNLIRTLRNDHYFFINNGLHGYTVFESGKCFEFAMGLYNHLKSIGENPNLIFLVGNMKKSEAQYHDVDEYDPSQEHVFHTIVQVRKFYYDINGKLGNKRDISAMWDKFRNKKLIQTTPEQLTQYITDKKLIEALENQFKSYFEN